LPNPSGADSLWQMNRRVLVLAVLALPLLTCLVYIPALRNGFIWDDDDHLTENRAVAASDGLKKIWTSLAVSRYYPLTLTTFWVQRRLWGLNPLPYHAVNIVLHGVNAALLFLILRRLNVRGALAVAALWAVHPVNTESVAWVTELKNIQSGLFFFLSLLCFLQFDGGTGPVAPGKALVQNGGGFTRGWYALSLLCFAAALLSKPSTVVLPLVLLLLAWWRRGRVQQRDAVRAASFFVLAVAMSVLTVFEQRGQISRAGQEWPPSLTERVILAGKALWFYASKVVWPADLIFVYPRWKLDADSLLSLMPLAGAASVGFMIWRYRTRPWAPAAAFGLGYFLIALLPVLGLFDIYYFRYSFVADHFQYLAGPGVLALATAGCFELLQNHAARRSLFTGALIVLAAISWRHTSVFRDNETLWRDTMRRNPQAAIAYNNLGAVLNSKKQYEAALGYLREALRLRPGTWEPHDNMAIALTGLGRYDEALFHLQQALQIRPDFANSHYRLAVLYQKMNHLDDAARQYQLAVRFHPEAYFGLGVVSERLGEREAAMKAYQDALRINPNSAFAHNNLANLLAEDGELDEAIEQYRLALAADPRLEDAQRNLGIVLRQTGALSGAIEHLRRAVELEPGNASAQLELGRTLLAAHRYAEAVETFRHGLEVRPQHIALGNALAWVLATCPEEQLRDARQAVRISERLVESTDRKLPQILDTLAAAYAEAGRFDDAATTARDALTIAQSNNETNLATQIAARLALYKRHQPYRLVAREVQAGAVIESFHKSW
jgi:tetratricopeptide (TPR) repeat protein